MDSTPSRTPVQLLLVEDDPGDARLTREALRDGKLVNRLSVVRDGVEALAFLRRQEPYADAPRPDLILLDLDLPRKDGRELLQEVTADPALCDIPVVVVTPPEEDRDLVRTFGLPAVCCVSRPVGLEQLITVVQSVQDFWLTIVRPLA